MKPLIELVLLADGDCDDENPKMASVADVGCDHGIVSLSLACMALASEKGGKIWKWAPDGRFGNDDDDEGDDDVRRGGVKFSRVVGSDVSAQALENGALVSLEKVRAALPEEYRNRAEDGDHILSGSPLRLPVDFRVGDGLQGLRPGDADGIILAGMGAKLMSDILFGPDNDKTTREETLSSPSVASSSAKLDELGTQYIFVQPTNSRPSNLISLYDRLQLTGDWELMGESIAFLDGRWYINSAFERSGNSTDELRLPGHYLSPCNEYSEYVKHHTSWLAQKMQLKGGLLEEEDARWIRYLSSDSDNAWRDDVTPFDID